MMELRKSGFTITEFIISISIMFLVAAAAFPILFKKAKKPTQPAKKSGEEICSCQSAQNGSCTFSFSNSETKEFFTIQMIGGGASGGKYKGGGAGEAKIVYYPALNGKYVIQLGKGGKYSNGNGQNGGNTVLYKQNDNGSLELVEYARGGVTNNEKIDSSLSQQEKTEQRQGQMPAFSEGEISVCGKGGNSGDQGTMGEVVIRW